jgi:uncharacterized protein
MKDEIRVIGIDDSPFEKFRKGNTLVIGTVFRGGKLLDGIMTTRVRIDGVNATEKIAAMINLSKYKPQLRCIFLDGIAVGGFNIIDIHTLHKKTGIPVIVIIRKKPDIKTIKRILAKLGKESRIRLLEKAGIPQRLGAIYVQLAGISATAAKEILEIACTRSSIPEAIRVSHIIASGIAFGENKGKA